MTLQLDFEDNSKGEEYEIVGIYNSAAYTKEPENGHDEATITWFRGNASSKKKILEILL